MPSGQGQRTALRYVGESALGIASGTTFKALRKTGDGLQGKKATLQSNEARADRQLADLRHGFHDVAGDISVELGLSTFDDLIEAAVSGTWAAVTTGSTSLAATTGTNTITRTAGSFITDGFNVGDEIATTGFSVGGNNLQTKIATMAADGLSITVEKPLSTEAAAAGKTVALIGKKVKAGTNLKTFTFERAFADLNLFELFTGVAIDQFKLSVQPGSIITAVFSAIGKEMKAATGVTAATVVTPAATNPPFDAFSGGIYEGGAASAVITGLELTIANGRSTQGVIGQRTTPEIHEGQFLVTGNVTAYFQSAALVNKFLNETDSSLDVKLGDLNGTDFHRIRIPRLKYTGADRDIPRSGPVMVSLPFTGLVDSVSGTSFIYQRSNVA